jgi:hypothetical protein
MSVWDDPHYRSEPLQIISQYLDYDLEDHPNLLALCDWEIGDYGHFDVKVPKGNFKQNILEGKAKITQVAYKFSTAWNENFSERFKMLPPPKCGIDAVYTLFDRFFSGKIAMKNEFEEVELKDFCQNMLRAYGPANYASPVTWEKYAKSHFIDWSSDDRMCPLFWFQQAESVRHLNVAQGLKSFRRAVHAVKWLPKLYPWIESQALFGVKEYHWKITRYRGVTILWDTERNESYVLLGKDLKRLGQLLESTGKIYHYFSFYADRANMLSTKMTNAAHDILELLIGSIRTCTPHEMNSICRSMDIAQFIYLAKKAGPLAHRSVIDQMKKGFDGHYDKVFPLAELVAILEQFRIREAMELVSIRKILPVPDFCIYSAMNNNYQMHMAPHEQIPHFDKKTTFEDFKLFWRHSMIRNYFDRHGKCPGYIKEGVQRKDWHQYYPHRPPSEFPYSETNDIEYRGTFSYSDYNFSEHELRKDKTMAPNRLSDEITADELAKLPVDEKNQIANFFLNRNLPRIKTLRENLIAGVHTWDWVHTTALKPEAKKEGGRMFYMANDAQRVMMSEKEANIADYLVHKAGNSSGISDIDLAARMSNIAAIPQDMNRKVYVSFDLDKWSPKQNPKLKEAAYEQWEYAFGLPHITKLLKVHKGARLAFIKHNVHHEYINPGQDMEGYDAKTNTAMHIEVMGYAINVCRRLKLLKKGAKLLALIDDGGMSLEFDPDETDENIWKCINCIEDVYNMVGLRISWDKTFVSEQLFIYLNEIYYKGFKVTPGLKAFLRVGKLADLPAKTIVDDLDAIAGEIQGAIKAGASYRMAYAAYVLEVYKVIKRWSRYKQELGNEHIIMCMFPVAFGGIGVRSLLQITTNEAFNPVAAGIANLKAFCHTYPKNAPMINRMLNSAMRTQSADTFVRAPRAIRTELPTLNLQRFGLAMRDWLLMNAKNPYITDVLAAMDEQSSSEFALRMKSMKRIGSVGLQAIASMRPEAALDTLIGKLQRSTTASELLGHKMTLRLTIANRFQAVRVINEFGTSHSVQHLTFVR